MAKRKVTKSVSTRRKATSRKVNSQELMKNQFFGMLLIAIAVGALIVFVRYLLITISAPADVYLIEPAQLIPGLAQ